MWLRKRLIGSENYRLPVASYSGNDQAKNEGERRSN